MSSPLKSILIGVDGQMIGPYAVSAETADRLLAWHDHGKEGGFLLLGQLPTGIRDDTVRTVALQLARGHVGYIQVESVSDA